MANKDIAKYGVNHRFKKGNKANPFGNPKPLPQILKELGESTSIDFEVTIVDKEGNEKTQSGKMISKQGFNHLIGAMLIKKCMSGDLVAIKTYFDLLKSQAIKEGEAEGANKDMTITVSYV